MSDEPAPPLALPPGPATATPWKARLDRDTLVLLVVTVLAFSFDTFVDPDLPGHLGFGLAHLHSGSLTATDPYSYTVPGEPWINHEWLFELAIAWIWTHAGDAGLVLLQALAWGGTGLLILGLVRRSSRDLLPGAVAYLMFISGVVAAITIRPQLFTYLFFAVELLLLERARAGQRWALALLPPLIAVWTNVHGGFLAGLGVFGLFAAGLVADAALGRAAPGDLPGTDPRARWTAALACGSAVLAGLATLLNPYGAELHRWLQWSLVMPNPGVSEWRPLSLIRKTGGVDLHAVFFLTFIALSAAALVARAWREPRRIPLAHAFVLLVTAVLGVRHVRHVPFFAMAAAAFVPGALSDLYRRFVPVPAPGDDLDPTAARRMRVVFALLGAFAITGKLLWPSPTHGLKLWLDVRHDWPTGAIRYLDERIASDRPERRLFVFFDWAQLAIWRWHPRLLVFYDGRHRTVYMRDARGEIGKEFPQVEAMHFDFLRPDPERTLDWHAALEYPPGHGAELVLIPAGGWADDRMRAHPGFRLEYEDDQAVLYARRTPGEPDPAVIHGPSPPVAELPFDPRPGLER
jgi:hypothetical protein